MRSLFAGIAQLVERNLAKVEVASSTSFPAPDILGESMAFPLVPGSGFPETGQVVIPGMARWQSGYAAACKAIYIGSIPVRASV